MIVAINILNFVKKIEKLKCEQHVVIGSKAEWHSHKDTQIVIKMVPPLHRDPSDWEHGGDSTLDEDFFGSRHEGLNARWIEVQHASGGKYVEHANQKLVEVNGTMMEQLPTQLVSIDDFVKLAKEDVKISKYLHKEYVIFSLYFKVAACECFEFIVKPLSEWMKISRCSLHRIQGTHEEWIVT